MNGDSSAALWYLLALMLPLAALFARRLPIGNIMRMALIWVAIFAVGLILATLWTRNRAYWDDFLVDAGLSSVSVRGGTVSIPRDENGHFWVEARLNGVSKRMLIDTGATQTTLGREAAQAAGVKSDDPFGVIVNTANGPALERRATLRTIEIGSISARDFPILISQRDDLNVIGVDLLSSLKNWRTEGNRLVLEARK